MPIICLHLCFVVADVPPARHMEADTAGNLPTQIYGQLTTRPFFIYGPILSKDRVAVCNLARDLAILSTGVLYERNLLDIPPMKVRHSSTSGKVYRDYRIEQQSKSLETQVTDFTNQSE